MNEKKKGLRLYVIITLILAGVLIYSIISSMQNQRSGWLTDADFRSTMVSGKVEEVSVTPIRVGDASMGTAVITLSDGSYVRYYISNVDNFRQEFAANYPSTPLFVEAMREDSIWSSILPMLLCTVLMIVLFMVFMNRMGGSINGGAADFGKSKAEKIDPSKNPIRFDNVAGLKEEKEQMEEIVTFLKQPEEFIKYGARIPKGILLVGPPGTGKTYLAKAVAGEAGVPFYSISGSDFVEMFVGVGASRVRDMFAEAKSHAPCIVFIDEIDAVGRHRGAGLGGSHDEREQTLNQLLVEMDGFTFNQGVIVLAATNRVDILDHALLRPGRFDRQINVGRPDAREREEVLLVHSKDKPIGSDVDLHELALITAGATPADLENLMNEAAINAAKSKRPYISDEDIKRALIRVTVGTEKKSRIVSEKEKNLTAYHEAGHAILHQVLPLMEPVAGISIIPTGGAGGYTMALPDDTEYMSKNYMEQEIITLLGGRIAEELKCGDITTGASNDIERATALARSMVTRYGMSSLGPIQFGKDEGEVFLGREINETRTYSEEVASKIDKEISAIITKAYEEGKRLLIENDAYLEKTRDLLMKQEKISGEEFRKLFEPETAPEEQAEATEE